MSDNADLNVQIGLTVNRLAQQLAQAEQRMNRAANRSEQAFRRANASAAGSFRQIDRAAAATFMNVDRLASQAQASIVSGFRGVALGLSGGLLGAAGVEGFRRAIVGAVSEVSTLGKQARAASMGVEELQGLMFGLSQATGVTDGQIASAFERFNRRIGDAANGTGPLIRSIERYGIALRSANGELRSQGDLLRDVAEVAARLGDQERSALLQSAFGDVGRQLAQGFTEGAAGIDEFIRQAREAGVVIRSDTVRAAEELDDRFELLQRRVRTFFRTLAVEAADTVINLRRVSGEAALTAAELEGLLGVSAAGGMSDETRRGVSAVVAEFEALVDVARDASMEVTTASMAMQGLGRGEEAAALRGIAAEIQSITQAFADGRMSAEEMTQALDRVTAEARRVVSGMDDVDRARVANVTRSVDFLTEALRAAAKVARDTADAIREVAEEAATVPEFPVFTPDARTPRPRNAPRDIDFGLPPVQRPAARAAGRDTRAAELEREIEARRRLVEAIDDQVSRLELEVGLVGRSTAESARARAAFDMLAAAKRAGIDVDTALTDSGETLRSVIERQSEAVGRLAGELELAREQQQLLESVADQLAAGFLSAMIRGDDFRQTLANITEQLARLALQAALFGTGPFGGLFGSPGVGLMRGFRSGGFTGAGSPGDVAGVVHKREFVFDAPAVQRIGVQNLERLRQGVMNGYQSGGLVGSPTVNVAPPTAQVVVIDDPERIGDYLATARGERHVLQILRRNGVSDG